jgi:type I restriction enzyme M protein
MPEINLFCQRNSLTNEATVESFFLLRLFEYLGYKDRNIMNKKSLSELTISQGGGRKRLNYKPDFVLTIRNKPKIVIDAKEPEENIDDYFYQVSGYALGLNQKYEKETPVEFTILSNGFHFKFYRWDKATPILTMDFDDFNKDSLKLKKLKEIIGYKNMVKRKQSDLKALSTEFEFRRPSSNDEIEAIFRACHQIIWDKENMKPSEAFPEFAKLFFIKVHFDKKIHAIMKEKKTPVLDDYVFSINWIEKQEKELDDTNPVANNLFEKLRSDLEDQIKEGKKKRVFNKDETVNISSSTIKEVVKLLEHYDLLGIDEDLNGRMFESFLSATVRGKDLGQFFTPRTVVKFMTHIAHLKANNNVMDKVLDGFCGSGGFLIDAMGDMHHKIHRLALTPEEKEKLDNQLVGEYLFGIDADKSPYFKISRIARMNMIMHGDGNNRIYWLPDTLDKNIKIETDEKELRDEAKELKGKLEAGLLFDVVLSNPPFSRGYSPSKKADADKLEDYDIARKKDTEKLKAIHSNVLSLERYRDLLKPHGKLITVMDESVLNSYSGREYRDFIRKYFIIRAIISLPQNSFVNAEANVKTSILYLVRKKVIKKGENGEESEVEDEEQPDVFMGVCEDIGHTDSGKSNLESNTLLKVYDYANNLINKDVKETIEDKFLEFEKEGTITNSDFTFVAKKEDIQDRLDCYSHQPSYKKLLRYLHNLESKGKIVLKTGRDLNIIKQMSKDEYEQSKLKSFKYIDIGNTEKDLGHIKGCEEDLLINLPTRARMVIKENDILIPAPVHSASGIIIVPKEFDGQLCSTGFIVIRPKDHKETILLYAILKSEIVQKQFFHLQSGINQQSITDENFKEFILLPIPKEDNDREAMIGKIKELRENAKELRKEYNKKLSDIQGEFIKVIGE